MAQVKKLSGKNCLYYKRGRCTRPLTFPPPEEQLCILVLERKRLGQNTLDRLKRLERFGLTIHDRDGWIAQRYIVNKNLKEMANRDSRVVITDKILKFHANDRREEYKQKWIKRINELGI